MIELYKSTHDSQVVMGTNGATPLWVAEDGSWGTTPITIFDAHYWTASDFQDLDDAASYDKVKMAKMIADETSAKHSIERNVFLDLVRQRSAELGLRMFLLTDDGMDELE